MEKELIQVLNRQMATGFSNDIPVKELRDKLIVFLNDLIQHDFQKLLDILYKVDVDESKLKKILKEQAGKDTGSIIADLVLEREMQKIKTREQYKRQNKI